MLSSFFFIVIAVGVLSVGSQIFLMLRATDEIRAREHQWQYRYMGFFHACFATLIAACDLSPAFTNFFGIGEQVLGVKVAVTIFAAVLTLLATVPVLEYWLERRDMKPGEKIIDRWLQHHTKHH